MNTTGIKALDDMLRSAAATRFGGGEDISVSIGTDRLGARGEAARDPCGTQFMNSAMNFADSSRGQAEQNFFDSFAPQNSARGMDIRISLGFSPSATPACAPPPPPPMLPPPPPPDLNPTHASTTMQGDKAVFENDNYIVKAGHDTNVDITNKKTGATYQVSGDPHVAVNGKHAFDFWGTTSFALDDGTKLTFGTAEAGNGMTEAAKLTITSGGYGAQIKGINTNPGAGPLALQQYAGQGRQLDDAVADGVTLNENAAGNDLVVTDRNGHEGKVDQSYIDSVDLQKTQGEHSSNTDQFDALDGDSFGGQAANCNWAYIMQAMQAMQGFGSSGYGGFNMGGGTGTGLSSLGGFGDSPSLGDTSSWMKALQEVIDRFKNDDGPPPPPPRPRAQQGWQAGNGIHVGLNLSGQSASRVNLAINAGADMSGDLNLRVWG